MDDSVGFIHRRLLVHTLVIRAAHARALITRRRPEHQALRNFSTEKDKKRNPAKKMTVEDEERRRRR
jgi:hypothetical protein